MNTYDSMSSHATTVSLIRSNKQTSSLYSGPVRNFRQPLSNEGGDVEMRSQRCARLDVHRESSFRDSTALRSTEAVWDVLHRHVCLTRSRPASGLRVASSDPQTPLVKEGTINRVSGLGVAVCGELKLIHKPSHAG